MSRVRKYLLEASLLLVVGLLSLGAYSVSARIEAESGGSQDGGKLGALPDGRAVRLVSLSLDRLVADLFWVRTVHYVGDERTAQLGYARLDDLANLVTDVDPTFKTVYVVMSGGIAALQGDPDAALGLLEKGIRHVDYWKLHFLLGTGYFIEKLDYGRAAEQLQLAAQKGGPKYLSLLASRLYANAGDRETALAFIRARLEEERDEGTRKALEKRFWDLWITRDLERIDTAIESFRLSHGRVPADVAELVSTGELQKAPEDPKGGSYSITDGRATTQLHYDPLGLHVPYRAIKPTDEIERAYERMRRQQDEETP